jgi:hypothetical protein
MNVNAPRRPVEDEHFTLRPRLLGHHRFPPVPDRQIADKRVHIGRLDIRPAHVFTGFHIQSVVVYHAERAQVVRTG